MWLAIRHEVYSFLFLCLLLNATRPQRATGGSDCPKSLFSTFKSFLNHRRAARWQISYFDEEIRNEGYKLHNSRFEKGYWKSGIRNILSRLLDLLCSEVGRKNNCCTNLLYFHSSKNKKWVIWEMTHVRVNMYVAKRLPKNWITDLLTVVLNLNILFNDYTNKFKLHKKENVCIFWCLKDWDKKRKSTFRYSIYMIKILGGKKTLF